MKGCYLLQEGEQSLSLATHEADSVKNHESHINHGGAAHFARGLHCVVLIDFLETNICFYSVKQIDSLTY